MIVLQESGSAQELKFIPREYTADRFVLRDEQKNTETETLATFTESLYYLKTDVVFSLKEGRHYELTVKNGSDVVYRDRIFCTNQSVETYSINNNEYKEHTSTNEFIVYE
jgi:hypothetical protein